MPSEKKMRKVSKRRHWGRAGNWLKVKEKGPKGTAFFTSALRRENNKKFWL